MIVSECCGAISSTEPLKDEHIHWRHSNRDISYLGICSLCLEHSTFIEEDEND